MPMSTVHPPRLSSSTKGGEQATSDVIMPDSSRRKSADTGITQTQNRSKDQDFTREAESAFGANFDTQQTGWLASRHRQHHRRIPSDSQTKVEGAGSIRDTGFEDAIDLSPPHPHRREFSSRKPTATTAYPNQSSPKTSSDTNEEQNFVGGTFTNTATANQKKRPSTPPPLTSNVHHRPSPTKRYPIAEHKGQPQSSENDTQAKGYPTAHAPTSHAYRRSPPKWAGVEEEEKMQSRVSENNDNAARAQDSLTAPTVNEYSRPSPPKWSGVREDARQLRVSEDVRTPNPMQAKGSFAPSTSNEPLRPPRPIGKSESHEFSRASNKSAEFDKADKTASSPAPIPAAKNTPVRPDLPHLTSSQMDTRYVNMLLALDSIPPLFNMLASFFTWILLAGFLLFPGTFTSLQNLAATGEATDIQKQLLNVVAHVPLFVIAFICCGIGASGMCWLWWRWMHNYLWLLNKIFLPGLLNSLAGVISTIVNVFGVQHGQFSTTAKVTMIVTAVTAFICGVLVLFYQFWLVRRVKAEHDRQVGREAAGKHGEGIIKQMKKKMDEKQGRV